MDNSIVVSTPPHVKSKRTTRGIMIDVCISLLPATIAGCIFFGWQALVIILASLLTCAATEFVYFFIQNKGFSNKCADAKAVCLRFVKQFDFSSVVTGLILALILPVTNKWYEVCYQVVIGAIFAIAVVKMLFGGTGKNLVNPAAAGRVFLTISFASLLSTINFAAPVFKPLDSYVLTGATNLNKLLSRENPKTTLEILDLFLGTGVGGSIGETCKAAILLGLIYLIARNIVKWWQPILFIAVFGLAATLMSGFAFKGGYKFDINLFLPHILSGGVLFGAVFMFTDYATSPKGVYGQLCYYIVGALLVAVLRYFTKLEVTSFVILIMNLIVPLIDKYLIRRPFGYKKEENK